MPALGMGLAWGAYSLMTWGWMVMVGYNVTYKEWVNPFNYYSQGWPPPKDIPQDLVLPNGTRAATTAVAKKKGAPKSGPSLPVVPL